MVLRLEAFPIGCDVVSRAHEVAEDSPLSPRQTRTCWSSSSTLVCTLVCCSRGIPRVRPGCRPEQEEEEDGPPPTGRIGPLWVESHLLDGWIDFEGVLSLPFWSSLVWPADELVVVVGEIVNVLSSDTSVPVVPWEVTLLFCRVFLARNCYSWLPFFVSEGHHFAPVRIFP